MTVATKRKKLHELINTIDDVKVNAIFSIVESEVSNHLAAVNQSINSEQIALMKQAAFDPLFLDDLKEISDDFAAADRENI